MRVQLIQDEYGKIIAATTVVELTENKADPPVLQAYSAGDIEERSLVLTDLTIPEEWSRLSLYELCTGPLVQDWRGHRR